MTIIKSTPRGQRMLATVLEMLDEIELEMARALPRGAFTKIRQGLKDIADVIDPEGALGTGDIDGR